MMLLSAFRGVGAAMPRDSFKICTTFFNKKLFVY